MIKMTLWLQILHTLISLKLCYHLLTWELPLLENYQTPSEMMKNQVEAKTKTVSITLECNEFVHCTADLIGSLHLFHF